MSDYHTKFSETCLNQFEEEIEQKVDGLVSNKSMDARQVDYDRGFIAGLRRAGIIVGSEVPKKIT